MGPYELSVYHTIKHYINKSINNYFKAHEHHWLIDIFVMEQMAQKIQGEELYINMWMCQSLNEFWAISPGK
jgi:arginine decarboxylase-like protein